MFKKGDAAWNKGLIGYRAGRTLSEKLKKKISKSCTGRKVWINGKTHSEKTKQKIRQARLKNNPGAFEAGKNHRRWNGGSKAYYGKIAHLVWENYWRQKVPEGQLIHHFDGNIKNFDETNLVNMPFGFHSKYHRLKEQRL